MTVWDCGRAGSCHGACWGAAACMMGRGGLQALKRRLRRNLQPLVRRERGWTWQQLHTLPHAAARTGLGLGKAGDAVAPPSHASSQLSPGCLCSRGSPQPPVPLARHGPEWHRAEQHGGSSGSGSHGDSAASGARARAGASLNGDWPQDVAPSPGLPPLPLSPCHTVPPHAELADLGTATWAS